MGVVHEAWDTRLARPVALKVISAELANDVGFRERFTHEARVQAALDSEHVVRVFAHGEDDGRLWIATQLVPDGDLGALLRRYGAPPFPVAVDLIGQVASGLADAHDAGLVHRDIKPANVLLRRGPRIRAYLADFGIARPLGAEVTSTGAAGTPSYMAPELHTGGTAGIASDVYSLGCLLWAALTGAPPYAGGSDFEVATAHRTRPVPELPGRDARTVAVNRVLRTAMAKRPGDRYPSAREFADDLAAAAALPETGPRRRWSLAVASAAAVAVVAVVVVVVVVGTGWVLTRSADGPQRASGRTSASASASASVGADAEHRATGELADSLTTAMSHVQAECVASFLVDDLGFGDLVDAGFFDEDGHFLDPDLAGRPAIRQSLTQAARSCVG